MNADLSDRIADAIEASSDAPELVDGFITVVQYYDADGEARLAFAYPDGQSLMQCNALVSEAAGWITDLARLRRVEVLRQRDDIPSDIDLP